MTAWPAKWPGWLPATLFALALGAALWRQAEPPAPVFAATTPATAPLPPLFAAGLLPPAGATVLTASLAELADGRIGVAWTAGSSDDATDLAIHFSTLDRAGWSQPVPIATRESTAGGLFAHVRRIGAPLLHADGDRLHLWYASTGIGGLAGALVHSRSTDGGRSWSKPARVQTSPFANLGNAASAPPLPLADGGLGLPLDHELFSGHGEWLRLAASGRIFDKVRLAHAGRPRQPAVVALDQQRALALLRDAGPAPGQIRAATTVDGGQHWQAGAGPGLANPDAPLALLRLPSGRLLLAGNPQQGREVLQLWLSADQGQTWQASRSIEAAADGAADFSSPALLLGRDGRIHLAYSWRRQGIRYATFSEAWLIGGTP
jgi:predicted neuraminidase